MRGRVDDGDGAVAGEAEDITIGGILDVGLLRDHMMFVVGGLVVAVGFGQPVLLLFFWSVEGALVFLRLADAALFDVRSCLEQ